MTSDSGKRDRYYYEGRKQCPAPLNQIDNNNNDNKKSQYLANTHFMIRIHHVLPFWYSHPSHLCHHRVFLPGSGQPSRRKMSCKHKFALQVAAINYPTYDIHETALRLSELSNWPQQKRTKKKKQQGCLSKALLSPQNIECSVDKISPCFCAWAPLRDINFCCLVNNCLLSPEGMST